MWKLIVCLSLFSALIIPTKAGILDDIENTIDGLIPKSRPKTKDKGCNIGGSGVSDTSYRCHKVKGPFLKYYPSLENITSIEVSGDFSTLVIDSKFMKVEKILLSSRNLEIFNFSDYKNLPSLKRIKFYSSKVGRITTDGVESMTNLKAVEFMYSDVKDIGAEGFTTLPALEEFGFSRGQFSDFSFTMLPTTTKFLSFTQNSLNLPESACDIFKRFSVLESLTFTEQYNMFDTVDFTCLPSTLHRLDMQQNSDTRFINLEALKSFSNLHYLDLSYNSNIETFNISALPSSINKLALKSSKVITSPLTSITCNQVGHLTNLSEILLGGNQLTDIDFNCIPKNVQVLNLGYNHIKTVSCAGLKKLPKLTKLDLGGNQIEEFDFDCLINENMEYLYLGDNKIKNLNIMVISLRHLPHLNLLITGNEIDCSCTFLHDFFQLLNSPNNDNRFYCSAGECLTCDENSQLQGYPFAPSRFVKRMSLPDIKKFDNLHEGCLLTRTRVSNIGNEFEEGCTYENVFDLVPKIACKYYSSNFINYYPAFESLESLDVRGDFRTLGINGSYEDLTHIKIQSDNFDSSFHFNAVQQFSKLAILDLSDNQIQTIYTNGYPPKLRILNLNNNQIASLNSPDSSLENFSFLRELSLSHNKLVYFDINLLPVSMRKLDLSNNAITTVGFPKGTNLSFLKVIDLSWNDLSYFNLDDVRPRNLEELVLSHNNILSISSQTKLNFVNLNLNIKDNSLICDCDFYATYTTALAPITACSKGDCFTCRNDSDLINYPWWSNDLTQLENYNKMNNDCSDGSDGHIIRASFTMIFVSFVLNFLSNN